MKNLSTFARSALMGGALAAMLLGTYAATASAARPRPGGCVCPAVYAPVLCPNGRTYSNDCVARCHGQTNCTPIFEVPPPIE